MSTHHDVEACVLACVAHVQEEAVAVWAETGLTPRQLAEQRADLLDVLEDVDARWDDYDDEDAPELGKAIRAAIAKARGPFQEPQEPNEIDTPLRALAALVDESSDWESALEGARPSLTKAMSDARAALSRA
jgi:hypothetical protein